MKIKVFTAILLCLLVTYTVCEVAEKPGGLPTESLSEVTAVFMNPLARRDDQSLRSIQLKFSVHTSPNTDSFISDDERIGAGSMDGRILPASKNTLKSIRVNPLLRYDKIKRGEKQRMRKFAARRSARRHKVSVSSRGAKMRQFHSVSRNGKDKEAAVLHAVSLSSSTGEPYKRNSNTAPKLTILPTGETITPSNDMTNEDSDRFFEDDSNEKDEKKPSRIHDHKDDFLPNSKPKVTGHEKLTKHGGTLPTPHHKMAVYPGMKISSGPRWNVAYEHSKLEESKPGKDSKKKKKKSDSRTEDPADSDSSATIVAGILAGILMLWFIFSCGPRLWSIIKRLRWRRRHCRDFGINFPSTGYLSEELSEEEVIFDRTTIGRNKKSPVGVRPRSTPNASTIKLELAPATYQSTDHKSQGQKIWMLTGTPKSTPLMAVPTLTDTSSIEVWTANEIPESNSLDSSSTTSSLSDVSTWTRAETARSESLTSVSSVSLKSEWELPGCDLAKETLSISTSFTTQSKLGLSTSPEVTFEVPTVAPPKESTSLSLLHTSANELTRTVFMATDGASSSTESCKRPVAPRNDVAITIDEDEDEIICKSEKSQYEELSTVKDDEKDTSREEVVIRIEHCDIEGSLKQSESQSSSGEPIYTREKLGMKNVTTGNAVIDVISRDEENEAPLAENDNCKDAEPPWTLPAIPPSTVSTELRKGKSLIGGRKALENRRFIKHLISEQELTGFKLDLNTAISRILGEKKSLEDKNKGKRNVIKHQTQETKYSLAESIFCAKSMIMNENVDKECNKRSFLCRQTIQQTLSYPVRPALRSQRTLAREIAFAKEIILPSQAHSKAAVSTNVKRQARCKDVSINPLNRGASKSNSNTRTIYLNDKDYEKWELIQKDFEERKEKGIKPGAFVPGLKVVEDFCDFPLPAVDHDKNPQAGCRCCYCQKQKKKSRRLRFLKLPSKLLPFKSKSSSAKQSRPGFDSSPKSGFVKADSSTSSAESDITNFNAK